MIDYLSFYEKYVKKLKKTGGQYLGLCPMHNDTDPSFVLNPSNGLWSCMGACGRGGNSIQFCEIMGLPKTEAPDYDPSFRKYSYQGGRVKKRFMDKKVSWEGANDSNKTPYNVEAVELARSTGRRLWICEGEKDQETIHSAGELAIGIPSASDLGGINKVDFTGINEIILAFDKDKAGQVATERVLEVVPFASVVQFPEDKPDKYDVTNCYEEYGPEGFLSTLTKWIDADTKLADLLIEKLAISQSRDPNEPLGYKLTKFKPLQENIDGVQSGLYIIGADTSLGKTSFCVNLFLDLIETNPELTGIYFSLDDNQDIILNRLLAIQSAIPINKIQKRLVGNEYSVLEMAYRRLIDLSGDKRLFIYDQSKINHVNDVEKYMRRKLGKPLFVIIDGLFNLDVDEDVSSGIREKNIARANALKRLADTYRIPVICTAELRKNTKKEANKPPIVDDIMETGKFKYNANLILLIYPEKMDMDIYDNEEDPTIEIKYAKNKLSHYRRTDLATFHRTYSGVENMRRKG
jgi:hypothetical protein